MFRRKKTFRTNYFLIFLSKVQNVAVFFFFFFNIHMIRIRIFGPQELFPKGFSTAQYRKEEEARRRELEEEEFNQQAAPRRLAADSC